MRKKLWMVPGMLIALVAGMHAQITPSEAVAQMGRGINLGNTLEPPSEGGWNNPKAQESYFDDYVEAGFNTVRIPITWDNHVGGSPPYTIQESWLDRVEEVMEWGLSRDMFVIINAHHEDWLKETFNNESTRARFDSIWSQISVRFKGKSEKLFFEMLNEPRTQDHNGLTQIQIDEMNARILGIIRKDHPTRIVVYSGKGWSSSGDMMAAAVPDDPYIMAYFHSYDPWNFAGESNGTWGSASNRNSIYSKFAQIRTWADQHNLEVLLGEFGAMYDCDYNSRMIHYATYVKACLKYNIPFTVWDDGGWFEVLHRADHSWNDMKDILIHGTLLSPDNITISVMNDTSLNVQWTPGSEEFDTIRIERRVNNGQFVPFGGTSPGSTSFLDTLTETGNFYTYRVIATQDSIDHHSYPVKHHLVNTVRTPFTGSFCIIPGIVEAENFDLGGEGLSYHETTDQNIPGAYRPDEGVDIEARTSGGYQIAYVEAGEWVEYCVDVAESGPYHITVPVASMDGGGKFRIRFPGIYSEAILVPKTSSWQTTTEVTTKMNLRKGPQIMKVQILSLPPFNLDKFTFSDATALDDAGIDHFSLYPNPAGDRLFIRSDQMGSTCSLSFFSTDGKMVKQVEHVSPENGTDISDLSNGLYLLQIESDQNMGFRRFLKH